MKRLFLLFNLLFVLFLFSRVYGALGCSLNDPDRDVKRLFPESTGYKTDYITIKERGGDELKNEIETRLDDELYPIYESMDVPYAYYTVLKGTVPVGRIHGVNQKGIYGGMQLILATDPSGVISEFFYQKISSPEAKRFRDKKFTDQFIGLSLSNFDEKVMDIKDPTKKSEGDFKATLRGLKKNLILLDEFILRKRKEEL